MKPIAPSLSVSSLCLLGVLLCASSVVAARDVRMHGPNGDGASGDATATTLAPPVPTKQAPAAPMHGKAKTPPLFRSADDDTTQHAPRWHSFLPGMFR